MRSWDLVVFWSIRLLRKSTSSNGAMTSANLLAEDRALSIRSDIRTKSLPDSPFVRRGWSRGAQVSLKQSVGDFEHLPEVTPHLLAFQARNNAGAAKDIKPEIGRASCKGRECKYV